LCMRAPTNYTQASAKSSAYLVVSSRFTPNSKSLRQDVGNLFAITQKSAPPDGGRVGLRNLTR
ncbi:MAG: hypothetical protein ACQEW4_22815, partial [Bacillota bacterium]